MSKQNYIIRLKPSNENENGKGGLCYFLFNNLHVFMSEIIIMLKFLIPVLGVIR